MNVRSRSRRRPSPRRRPALLGGVVTALIGLMIGVVVACTFTERAVIADGPSAAPVSALAGVAPTTPALAAGDHDEFTDRATGCHRSPTDPAAPIQGAVPHREDHRLPVTLFAVPAAVLLERPGHLGFVPIDTTGPPSPALDLSTVLRI